MKPLHDNIIVKMDEQGDVSEGGIHLIKSDDKRPKQGEVLAVGPGKTNNRGNIIPMRVKPGDRVLVHGYGGAKKLEDGTLLMPESDILGVIE